MNTKSACELARQLKDVTEKDHWGGDGFYANKKIFATVWHEKGEVNLKMSLEQQALFCRADAESFMPVGNAWGRKGWTTVRLKGVEKALFSKALKSAWEHSFLKRKPVSKITRVKRKKAK